MKPSIRNTASVVPSAVVVVSAQELPIKQVSLFSSGVAHYVRDGQIDGNATVELPFKTDQINDILKSMVLQDLGGGQIRPVVYAPKDPIEKALRSFGIDLTGRPTLGALLDQIRGVPVELVAVGASVPTPGVILGVEKQRTLVDQHVIEDDVLNVACENGIRAYKLRELARIALADPKLNDELNKALAVLAGAHDADKKPVLLEFAGQGKRPVRVSYILEAPIWKTSYRLVLDNDKPFLQGWATVDNTTDDDWNNVQLTLVSGRPISFIQDLYEPLYLDRPEVRPELYASLRPRRYAGAVEDKLPAPPPPSATPAAGRRAQQSSRASRVNIKITPHMRMIAPQLSMEMVGSLDTAAPAAAEAGEMFAYPIDTPVTLPRQKSAMLPIVNQAVGGERFSIYDPTVHPKHPLNGLRLDNTTGLHLMQGPITVFEAGTYAGDAQLPDVTQGEKRLISYSLDLKREVEMIARPAPDMLTSVRIAKGTLIATRKFGESRTYNVKNKDDAARSVLIEQPFRSDWKLVEPAEPFERTPQVYRFRVEAKPRATTPLQVREERTDDQHVALANTGLDGIHFFIQAKVISPKVREALEQVVRLRTALDETRRQKTKLEARTQAIHQDQQRLRENVETVREGTELYDRYIKKLETQETEIDEARTKIADLTERETKQQQALDEYLLTVTVE